MPDEKPILDDPDQYPTDKLIASCLGKRKHALWANFFSALHKQHPDFAEEWRFYKDGHSWLMKVTQKKKTVFWLSVFDKAFKVTFYLSDKAEPLIKASDIPAELKKAFVKGKHYGKVRGLTIDFNKKQDIKTAESVIAVRLKV